MQLARIATPGGTIRVPVASTPISRALGLMFRKRGSLLLDMGRETRPGIWMLFMRFPLDIVFLDSRGVVVDLVEGAPPISLDPSTWRIYYPRRPARFVLELESGTAGRLGIQKSEKLRVTIQRA